MMQVGSSVGCIIVPFFIVRGRRWTIMCYCVVVFVTSVLAYFDHEYILICGRFCQGMFFGIHGAIFSVYNKEMSPPDMCGTGIAISMLAFYVGMMIPPIMGNWLGPVDDEGSFFYAKVIIMFPAVYALLHWLLYIFIFYHKTPAFNLKRG